MLGLLWRFPALGAYLGFLSLAPLLMAERALNDTVTSGGEPAPLAQMRLGEWLSIAICVFMLACGFLFGSCA